MRTRTRRPRAFRPLTDALEGRNTVSALHFMPELLASAALPAVAPLAIAPRTDDGSARAAASHPLTIESSDTRWMITAAEPDVVLVDRARDAAPLFQSADTTTSDHNLVQPLILDLSSVGVSADVAGSDATSIVTLSHAQPTPIGSTSGPVRRPIGSGSGDVAVPDPSPRSSANVAQPATASSLADDDGIRPMTLAPLAATGSGSDYFIASDADPSVSEDQTTPSGGDFRDPPHPIVHVSGGSWGGTFQGPILVPGERGRVPVGMRVSCRLVTDENWTFDTINWGGGTEYSNYFSGSAETYPAPHDMTAEKKVDKEGNAYEFITDATARTYTIAVTVTYLEAPGEPVTTEATFDSVRPKEDKFEATQEPTRFRSTDAIAGIEGVTRIGATMTVDDFTIGDPMFI